MCFQYVFLKLREISASDFFNAVSALFQKAIPFQIRIVLVFGSLTPFINILVTNLWFERM